MNTFPKSIRLKSVKDIDALFRHRFFLKSGNFRLYYLTQELLSPKEKVQFLVSVSKKNFPLAVNRNQIKRWIREAIRLEKLFLEDYLSVLNNRYLFAVTYLGNKKPDAAKARKEVHQLFQLWIQLDEKNKTNPHLPTSPID